MTDSTRRNVKSGYGRRLFWIAVAAILFSPLFPAAIRTLGEQSELRGRLAESQVAVLKHFVGEQ
ncbi:hypothetical protein CK228_31470 [Mesorhizobium sp. WSM4312]|uniref:hypothetical protein n=1 Tax=Mesorhizobium sp. WSM4312 TaxID=2029411 RepID=UPI000BAF08E7|nr:hypothetical protein [Mesorhizobium sp. WSM4312]PBB64737.1 hypothetical protein CK228_31470 [Mesorhizobium sp. WSM4312]